MEIKIRPGQQSDLEVLKEIDSFYSSGHLERAEDISDWIGNKKVYVGIEEERILAYTVLGESFFRRPTIEMLMVAKAHRGKGIGRELIRYLEGQVTDTEIWVSTNLSNQRMQRLLASVGFELTGFINNLDPGDPELFYFKKLKR